MIFLHPSPNVTHYSEANFILLKNAINYDRSRKDETALKCLRITGTAAKGSLGHYRVFVYPLPAYDASYKKVLRQF